MSSFKAYFSKNIRSEGVVRLPPHSSTQFVKGDLVYYDTATDTVKVCGANPALILGLAEADASSYTLDPEGKVPIRVLQPDDHIAMSSATDWAESYRYGTCNIVNTSTGLWRVVPGTSDGNDRVFINGGVAAADSLDGAIWYVQYIAANLQGDAIAS